MLVAFSLQTVFAGYADRAVRFMELPGEIPNRSGLSCSFLCLSIFLIYRVTASTLSNKYLPQSTVKKVIIISRGR